TWNWVGGVAPELAAGKLADDATDQVSVAPGDGAVVPPEETVVVGWLAKVSTAVTNPRGQLFAMMNQSEPSDWTVTYLYWADSAYVVLPSIVCDDVVATV